MRPHRSTYSRRAQRVSTKKRTEARARLVRESVKAKQELDATVQSTERTAILERLLCDGIAYAALDFTPTKIRNFQFTVEWLESCIDDSPMYIESAWKGIIRTLVEPCIDICRPVVGESWPTTGDTPLPPFTDPELQLPLYPCIEIAAAFEARRPELARAAAMRFFSLLKSQNG
ncbi:hypothetical protein MAE02_50960 [Microvirga aerophila]|uniref:Uncharacterized protein n=1 Tax=Microvirga aerophila TaxID=670291 RepID=A0A512BZN7_9HYPH|nr:hypothetical protein MAE02_50960 [Microvirga aerophila]